MAKLMWIVYDDFNKTVYRVYNSRETAKLAQQKYIDERSSYLSEDNVFVWPIEVGD